MVTYPNLGDPGRPNSQTGNKCVNIFECKAMGGTLWNNGTDTFCINCRPNSKFNSNLQACICDYGYF